MKLTEEQALSLQAGEFIHTIANHLHDGLIQKAGVDSERSEMIMELSEALRSNSIEERRTPVLCAAGFHISKHPRSV